MQKAILRSTPLIVLRKPGCEDLIIGGFQYFHLLEEEDVLGGEGASFTHVLSIVSELSDEEIFEISLGSALRQSKLSNQIGYNTTTDVLDKLCAYFDVEIGEVVNHVPDEE